MIQRITRRLGQARKGDVGAALSNLLWLAAERLTQVGVAIAISGILARYFGADLFGKWQYANTLLNVAAPITWVCGAEILVPAIVAANVATAAGTQHTAATRTARLGPIMGSAFALRMAVSSVALLLVWAVLAWGRRLAHVDPMVAAMLAGLAVTLLFREPFGVINAWLQARTYSKPALMLSLSTALVKAFAVYLLARAAFAPGGFGWLWAVESAAIGIGLWLYYRHWAKQQSHAVAVPRGVDFDPLHDASHDDPRGGMQGSSPDDSPARFAPLHWQVDSGLVKQFASAGAIFWLGLIGMYLFMKLDRLMLQHYVNFSELGRYAAAQQLNENWITLALMLAQTVAPAFIYRVSERSQLRRNLARLLALTGVVMATGALIIGLCAPLIVRIVFGPGFDAAAGFLRWAAWLSLPAGLEAICNLIILKYQAKYIVLWKWIAALIAAFVTNLLLIPSMGGNGALIGVGVGYVVALGIDALFIRQALWVRSAPPVSSGGAV